MGDRALPPAGGAVHAGGRARAARGLGAFNLPVKAHADEQHWLGIGSGEWEASGEPCWVRLDKTLFVPETDVHRRGTIIPPLRFERVASRLRDRFDWG
ncbi:hypothetical protein [Corynebacterium aquatimens]|uniref:hypothetical protein n=1 Tax=Corynebacterium aquatimens TaxID=1190508 RepID=UPI0025414903|nr:hypothetical protein [Corynebacterium aquatimens]